MRCKKELILQDIKNLLKRIKINQEQYYSLKNIDLFIFYRARCVCKLNSMTNHMSIEKLQKFLT